MHPSKVEDFPLQFINGVGDTFAEAVDAVLAIGSKFSIEDEISATRRNPEKCASRASSSTSAPISDWI